MICPKCKYPYYFLNKKIKDECRCEKCFFIGPFIFPIYEKYHENLYDSKRYTRTIKTDPQMKKIIKSLNIKKEEKILDLGCGVGDYTKSIADLNVKNIIGADFKIQNARKKYNKLYFKKIDFNKKLPFKDNYFDKIISVNVIEHLIDPISFLGEIKRILKPNGLIVITTANRDFILHRWFFDSTHLHEWRKKEYGNMLDLFFNKKELSKSSAMFNYYPFNIFFVKILKPDLLYIGNKL